MNNETQKIVYMENHFLTDSDTGEVKQKSTFSTVNVGKEPPYVKMYIDDLFSIKNVPSGLKNILFSILPKLDYDGYITLSKRFRQEVAENLGIKDQSFRNSLNKLCNHKILIRTATNEYMVNPNYFAKGDWKSVCEQRKKFKMVVEYSDSKTKKIIETVESTEEQQELDL